MKKLFLYILVFIFCKTSFGQNGTPLYPVTQGLGSTSTLVDVKGGQRINGAFVLGHFSDTIAANLNSYVKNYANGLITTDTNLLWIRSYNAQRWYFVPNTGNPASGDTLYWRIGGNYLEPLSSDLLATLGSRDSIGLYFQTNGTRRLYLPPNGINRSAGAANKYLMMDTTNLFMYYGDGGSGSGGIDQLTGDVTAGPGSGSQAATIANDAVTYAKIQNVGANEVLGRAANSSGDVSGIALSASQLMGRGSSGDLAAITLGTNLSMSGTTLNASGSSGVTKAYAPLVINGAGDSISQRFNVLAYGAVADGVTNTTLAFQNCINAVYAAGGGKIIVPAGTYLVDSLYIPANASAWMAIEIVGESNPATLFGTVGTFTMPTVGSIIKSNSTTAAAVIRQLPNGSDFSNTHVILRGLDIRTYDSTKISGVDMAWAYQLSMYNCYVNTNTYNVQSKLSAVTTACGIITPKILNGALTYLSNIVVTGYRIGIDVNEHTYGDYVTCASNYIGLQFETADQASHFSRYGGYRNAYQININGVHLFTMSQMNLEFPGAGQTTPTTAWQQRVYDLNDPSNLGLGNISWSNVEGGVGNVNSFLKNGGTGVVTNRIGTASITGAIANQEVVLGTGTTTVTSTPNLTYDGSTLLMTGSGNRYFHLNPTSAANQAAMLFSKNGTAKWQFGMDYAASGTADFYIYDQANTTPRMYINSGVTNIGGNALTGKGISIGSTGLTSITPTSDGVNTFSLKNAAGQNMFQFGTYPSFSTLASLWSANVTPSASNYTLLSDGNVTAINGVTDIYHRINNANSPNAMSITATGVGINKNVPAEALDVLGNVRFSGALMPNNTAGTSGQVLTSAGAGAVPTWTTPTGGGVSSVSGTTDRITSTGGATPVIDISSTFEALLVKLAGTQTITGVKTFSTDPIALSAASTSVGFRGVNDLGYRAAFGQTGSTFATSENLNNYSIFGSYTGSGMLFFTDGDLASGGTASMQWRVGGYNTAQERMRLTTTGLSIIGTGNFTGIVTVPTSGLTINATNVTATGTQLNYLNAAAGTTGTASTNLVYSTSPLFATPRLASTSTIGHVWTATDGSGNGSFQAAAGGSTDLAYTASSTNGIVTSSTGTDATIPLANSTNAGLLSPAGYDSLQVRDTVRIVTGPTDFYQSVYSPRSTFMYEKADKITSNGTAITPNVTDSTRHWEIPALTVVTSGDYLGATATQNLISYTVPNDGNIYVYDIAAMITITAVSSGVITTTLTYTDETNTSRTITFFGMGSTTAGLSVTGKSSYPIAGEILAYPNTSITVTSTLTVGTATYNGSSTVVYKRKIAQ